MNTNHYETYNEMTFLPATAGVPIFLRMYVYINIQKILLEEFHCLQNVVTASGMLELWNGLEKSFEKSLNGNMNILSEML